METILDNGLEIKLRNMVSEFKLENIENVLLQILEKSAKSNGIYYIGEMNKTDSML